MNKKILERLHELRKSMTKNGIAAWLDNGTDPHLSEYIPAHWQTRPFLSGFTGSYGWMAITQTEAALWTDSRYFLQAETELAGTGITMLKARMPDTISVENWVANRLKPGQIAAFNGQCYPVAAAKTMLNTFRKKEIDVKLDTDLIPTIWHNRPTLPQAPAFDHLVEYAGWSRSEKFDKIETELERIGADLQVVCALDDLAWCFNLRGADVEFNPVIMGYALLGKVCRKLFIDSCKLPESLKQSLLADGIELYQYDQFFEQLETLKGQRIYIDPERTNFHVFQKLHDNNQIVEGISIACSLKAIKTEAETDGFNKAMIDDALALLNFQLWLEESIGKQVISEYDIAQKLNEFRMQNPNCIGPSFYPIIGYKEHGAIVHIHVTPENSLNVLPEGVLLFDSGGQYQYGTTDITRTIALGTVGQQQKIDYTLVLKGVIALSGICFPVGTIGCHLDVLARQALWQQKMNYGHGTSHGVGAFLNVHEGPFSIRPDLNNQAIAPGMVMSVEPGIYRTGQYGIRIENMVHCVEDERNEFGNFLRFETLTLYPLDLSLIEHGLLSNDEKRWINQFHQNIYKKLLPFTNKTQEILLKRLTTLI
jgi:Xaa-Pro aminopeptidase